jgi:hypothetical protein
MDRFHLNMALDLLAYINLDYDQRNYQYIHMFE